MSFVQGKCESCGGILTVDPSLKAANCPFCGTAYVVQDSINYYNTTIKVETMHADVVNITDETSSEARIKAAEAYMRMGKFSSAEKEYKYVTELAPQNHLGWLGLIEARTDNYTRRIKSKTKLGELIEYSNAVRALAPNDSGNNLLVKWNKYLNSEEEKNKLEIESIAKEISEYEELLEELSERINAFSSQIEKDERRLSFLIRSYPIDDTNNPKNPAGILAIGIIFLFFGPIMLYAAWQISVVFILIGAGATILGIIGKKRLNEFKNEAKHLREDIDNSTRKITGITKRKEDVKQDVLKTQKLLNEYK